MIISASYKTDIPAFYGEWFLRRLEAGYCKTVNPYGGQISTVSLRPADIDGIVFWTKNAGPFLEAMERTALAGIPFYVQYAVNGYPRALEWAVTPETRAMGHIKEICRRYGPRSIVWRYDTVVETSITDTGFHIANFSRLAAMAEGSTGEVVVSFAQIYAKTRRNLDAAARLFQFEWSDPETPAKRELLDRFCEIASRHGIRVTLCAQPEILNLSRAADARCIDAIRLSEISGRAIGAKLKGNRPGCACYHSRDIGEYDTCPHGCVYCYAVTNRAVARRRHLAHDPNSEFLFAPQPRPQRERDSSGNHRIALC